MNKLYIYLLMLVLIISSCNDDIINDNNLEKPSTEYPQGISEGELIIKFKPEMTDILDQTFKTRAGMSGVTTRSGIPSTDEVLSILNAYHFERIFPVDTQTEKRTREAGMHLWYLIKFDKSSDIESAAQKLSQLGEISKIQYNKTIQKAYNTKKKPVLISKAGEQKMNTYSSAYPFNDPELYKQWGYINQGNYPFEQEWAKSIAGADINCREAWEYSTGDPSIVVAVLDEGVMWSHPDLEDNMWNNEAETLYGSTDVDGNGYVGDKYGYNFVKNTGIISWSSEFDVGHGTHVAGTIAAVNDNGEGVSGIAGGSRSKPGVKIMTLQLFDGQYGATLAMEAKAIKYAADNGAVILQCSWGYNSALSNDLMFMPGPESEEEWEELYPLEKEALDYFINNAGSPNGVIKGGLAIFASGNENSAMASFPAKYSGCIGVSSVAADYTPSSFTNYGSSIDLSAPGGDLDYYGTPGISLTNEEMQGSIYSTLVVDGLAGYGYMEGTSMACPAVAGVAALGLSYAAELRRHFSANEFKNLLINTSHNIDQYYTGEKLYHFNHSLKGSPATKMALDQYKGKMGGLIDAGALLRAVQDNGADMKVPNIYIAPNQDVTMDLSRYFVDGDKLTYTVSVDNSSIATVNIKNSTLMTIESKSIGVTNAIVKASNGVEHTITITVRKGAGDNGWM